MNITTSDFGKLKNGNIAQLFVLKNDNNITVKISNYGAIICSIEMPDKNGKIQNIVCGFNQLENYISDKYLGSYPYFGAIIGRFGNRIAKGELNIDGVSY